MLQHPNLYIADANRQDVEPLIGMAKMLKLNFQLFHTAEELLGLDSRDIGGILVSEFRLLDANGIDLQQKLRQRQCRLQTIFHTRFAETWLVVEAMRGGALTVIDKPAREHELYDAITLGMNRYNQDRKQLAAENLNSHRFATLSKRERQVLDLVLDGVPNKVAARKLNLSIRTIENCRHNIFEKTQTESVAQLVRLAFRAGLIA